MTNGKGAGDGGHRATSWHDAFFANGLGAIHPLPDYTAPEITPIFSSSYFPPNARIARYSLHMQDIRGKKLENLYDGKRYSSVILNSNEICNLFDDELTPYHHCFFLLRSIEYARRSFVNHIE